MEPGCVVLFVGSRCQRLQRTSEYGLAACWLNDLTVLTAGMMAGHACTNS